MSANRFEPFYTTDVTYRTINGYPLQATVLTPKKLKSEKSNKYPVLVHWHGGGLMVGHRLYAEWFSIWLLQFALSKNAIIISPDYRLLPEAKGVDILSDVEHFWIWVRDTLPSISKSWHARPDFDKIAAAGESAGGYLAVQSAVLFPYSNIKAIISEYGTLNANIPHFTIPGPKTIMGTRPQPPRQAERMIRSYLKGVKPGAIRTSSEPAELWFLVLCIIQQGYFPKLMATKEDDRLDVMCSLDKVERMPPIWVIHGLEDSLAPPVCSTGFVERLKTFLPNVPILLSLQPGEHAFDCLNTMEDRWVQEGCSFIEKFWP